MLKKGLSFFRLQVAVICDMVSYVVFLSPYTTWIYSKEKIEIE